MLSMLKMPLLMNLDELVPHLDGFVDFGSTPRSREHPFFIRVGAYVISLSHGFHRFFLQAGTAEREGEFEGRTNFLSMRKDGIEQMGRRENGDFDEAIVGEGILVVRFQVDGGMADGVLAIFINPGVF